MPSIELLNEKMGKYIDYISRPNNNNFVVVVFVSKKTKLNI